jgi:hypothetical protein
MLVNLGGSGGSLILTCFWTYYPNGMFLNVISFSSDFIV